MCLRRSAGVRTADQISVDVAVPAVLIDHIRHSLPRIPAVGIPGHNADQVVPVIGIDVNHSARLPRRFFNPVIWNAGWLRQHRRHASRQSLATGAGAGAGCGRSSRSDANAARLSPAESSTAAAPISSRNTPNRNGADDSETRAGAESMPVRSPYPAGPKTARGKVPLAIVIKPLPAPCATANTPTAAGPNNPSRPAPTGCISAAIRPDHTG